MCGLENMFDTVFNYLQLQTENLKEHMGNLSSFLLLPWFANPSFSSFKNNLECLISAMERYVKFLDGQKERTAANHSRIDARAIDDRWNFDTIEATHELKPEYVALNSEAEKAEDYCPIPLLNFQPEDCTERQKWMKHLATKFPMKFLVHRLGNYLGNLALVWKIPVCESERSDEATVRAIIKAKALIPKFSTRAMRSNFLQCYKPVGH